MEQIILLIFVAFWAYIWIRLVGKTGNNQWLGLLMLVPIANLILLIWLAFSDWPLERRAAAPPSDNSSQMLS